jgi:hypothetical protein
MQETGPEKVIEPNATVAQLASLLTQLGPDIPEISRRLGQYKESVRYRYKEKILKPGFSIQAIANHEGLGLRRVVFVANFAQEFRDYAQPILIAMNELCFVTSFSRVLLDGSYIISASVPEEHVDSYTDLISKLQEKGLFNKVDLYRCPWFRNIPMRTEFYDFNTGRWDFDWSLSNNRDWKAAAQLPSERGEFDYTDLLVLKELQMDATKPLAEIAAKLKINYKTLIWHYRNHLIRRGLVNGYKLNWMGTRYDFISEKALHRKHRYLAVDLLVKDLTDYEKVDLMSKLHKLPFVWSEAIGKDYYCELAFPLESVIDGIEYLEDALASVRDRAKCFFTDQSNALSFTISYQLYDENRKRWVFDLE